MNAFPDVSKIKYSISTPEIVVEGEDYVIDRYSDIFLGYIDIRDITLENSVFDFDVKLPENITAQNYVDSVSVAFDLEGYIESTFNVKQDQINIINVPAGYKISSNTSKVTVNLIGPEEVINNISAKDIVVQVDMSTREITQTGQYRVKADVFLPGEENAWATGTYSITITVKKL